MDPHATWDRLLAAFAAEDWLEAEELAEALLDWLDKGGFPPRTHSPKDMGPAWHATVARAACTFALQEAERRATP